MFLQILPLSVIKNLIFDLLICLTDNRMQRKLYFIENKFVCVCVCVLFTHTCTHTRIFAVLFLDFKLSSVLNQFS